MDNKDFSREVSMITNKQKQYKLDVIIKLVVIPIIIGFALVYTRINIPLIKIVGWTILIFGLSVGIYFLYNYYNEYKEKIIAMILDKKTHTIRKEVKR